MRGTDKIQEIDQKSRLLLQWVMYIPCLFILVRPLDNDIWFLLNHGRYVLQKGIPHIEPFTIHHGFHFVMQQWLSASLFWISYSSFGAMGLKLLVMLSYGLILFILLKLCLKISEDNFFISYIITFSVSILILIFMRTRPYIFSSLIFVIELYLMESYIFSNNKKYLYFLPLLSVLLINLHASMWPMLFVILIPYMLDSIPFKWGQGYERKLLLLMVFLMVLAGFLNPYGIEAMIYLSKSYGYDEINYFVGEMKAVNINSYVGIIVYGGVLAVTLCYCFYRKGTTKLRYVLLTLGTAYMAISSARSLLLFAVCGIFPLVYYFKDLKFTAQSNDMKRTLFIRKILVGIIVLSIPFLLYIIEKSGQETDHEFQLGKDAVNYILEQKEQRGVKLYAGYNEGGMAEFYGIPAYIDTRAEVFLKKNNGKADIMKEYYEMQNGLLYYKDVLNKYRFTDLLVSENDILYTYIPHDKDYKAVYSNEKYIVYERKDR